MARPIPLFTCIRGAQALEKSGGDVSVCRVSSGRQDERDVS